MADAEVDLDLETNRAVEKLDAITAASKTAGEAVDALDATDVDIAIASAELPSVKAALEDLRAEADLADAEEVSIDVSAPGAADTATELGTVETKAGDASTALDGTRDQAGKAGSAMQGMVGNTAGDLAAVLGVSGPAAQGLGQVADNALAGGAGLATIGPAAVGIFVAGTFLGDLADKAKEMAAVKAFNAAEVDAYVDALREGKTELEAIDDQLRKMDGVQFTVGSKIVDLTPILVEAGLNVDSYTKLVEGSDEQLDAWAEAMQDTGIRMGTLDLIVESARQKHDQLDEANERLAISTAFFGDEAQTAAGKADKLKTSIDSIEGDHVVNIKFNVTGDQIADASLRNILEGRGGHTEGNVTNYYPPAPTPAEVHLAGLEYKRVQEP